MKHKKPLTDPFKIGLEKLIELQQTMRPPKHRKLIDRAVSDIIKQSGLKDDPREQYFRLLAVCAMLNKEPRFRYWKQRRANETFRKAQ